MPWSTTRQLLFALGALVVIGGIVAGSYFFFFYEAPSCTDGLQNQDEAGIDCDGVCTLLCVQPNIAPLWSRSVKVAPGVYHATALIKNPNTSAGGHVPYKVSLFDEDNILVATREGMLRLLPGDLAPLFEANVVTGERVPARTFVDIGVGEFRRMDREIPPVRVLSFKYDEETSSVTALLENQEVFPVENITVTIFLFNSDDLITSASQTRIPKLDARERREIIFTWQEPFDVAPTRIDILPRVF